MENKHFNSIKVRLEPLVADALKKKDLFQFHKGTIRTASLNRAYLPTMPFQFHKGTIRTLYQEMFTLLTEQFQFHKGTIRTHFPALRRKEYHHFNSIKVRLEPSHLEVGHADILIFQFHKGTIRTNRRFCLGVGYCLISIP